MIPFTKLKQLADACQKITGEYVSVDVSYHAFESVNTEKRYTLYFETGGHQHFKTVQELTEAMERIIEPLVDEEVSVE